MSNLFIQYFTLINKILLTISEEMNLIHEVNFKPLKKKCLKKGLTRIFSFINHMLKGLSF